MVNIQQQCFKILPLVGSNQLENDENWEADDQLNPKTSFAKRSRQPTDILCHRLGSSYRPKERIFAF